MSAAAVGLHCDVWQPQDFSESHCSSSSSEPPEFFIDFYVSSYSTNQGDQIISTLLYKNFRQRCDVLTQDSFSWVAISSMLSQSNVPYHFQPFFIQQISFRARGIASEPNNALCRTIPLVVELILPEEDAVVDFGYESVDPHIGNGSGRASRASIEEMERIEIDDEGILRDCVICLDEIVTIGSVRMPCLHVFHRNCIRKWLQFSNLCPLCRFQMPMH